MTGTTNRGKDLTPQERTIAELVIRASTDEELAAELILRERCAEIGLDPNRLWLLRSDSISATR
jgi:FixJ family two-component response regulator